MCDSNRVKGTVKQYLVTEDNDIVVNDLGAFWNLFHHRISDGAKELTVSIRLILSERLKTS